MENDKKYYAFISYKREDEKWAKWLQHKLEHYKLPSNLNGRTDLPKEIRPIFRDQSELAAGVLADEIQKALEASKYLIVICSPRAAQSQWVGKEVQSFIDMGRIDKIIPFIVGGTAHAQKPEDECFPSALLKLPSEQELLGVNIDEIGRDAAAVKVVAQMFGLKFDTLWQRYEREHRRRRAFFIIMALLLALIGVGVAVGFSRQNKRITEQKREIEKQNEDIQRKNDRLMNDSIIMALQMDSINHRDMLILLQQDSLATTNDNLENANSQLTVERNNLKTANWKMMENQSRFVSEKVLNEVANGNLYTAQKLSLSILPENINNPNRPYTAQAEIALRKALRPMSRHGFKQISSLRGDDLNCAVDYFDINSNNICFFEKKGDFFLHNLYTDEEIKLSGHGIDINRLGFNKEGTKCFVEDNYSVMIWDVKSGNMLTSVKYYEIDSDNEMEIFDSIMFSNSFVIQKYEKDSIKLIHDTIPIYIEGQISVDSLFFVDNSGRVYSRFELSNGFEVKQLFIDSFISASSFSSRNSYLALGDTNGIITIVNPMTGSLITKFKGHDEKITSLEFTSDNRDYLISSSADSFVKIWDIETKKCINSIFIKDEGIISFKLSPSSSKIAIFSFRKNEEGQFYSLQMWSLSGNLLKKYELNSDTSYYHYWDDGFNQLAFSPKEDCLVVPFNEDDFIVWNIENNKILVQNAHKRYSLGNGEEYLLNVQYAQNGKFVVCTVGQGQHFVLDAANFQQLVSFEPYGYEDDEIYHQWIYTVNSLVSRRNHLLTISAGGVIREYDIYSGLLLQTIKLSDFCEIKHRHHDFYDGDFSPDGRYVFVRQLQDERLYYYTVKIPDLQTIIDETKERLKHRSIKEWEKRLYYLE